MSEILPEGTDHVLPGASSTATSTRDKLKVEAADLKDKAAEKASQFKDQATDKARDYAEDGKARVAGALDSVAKLIGDSAAQIDDKAGALYGDYVRKAAEAVTDFSDTLRDKDVDELIEDARDLVRKSPAIAIGAAAAAGFLLSRLIKAGSETLDEAAKAVTPKATSESEETAAEVSASTRKAPAAKRKPASDS